MRRSDDNDAWKEPKLRCQVDVLREKWEDCSDVEAACLDLREAAREISEAFGDSRSGLATQTVWRADRLFEEADVAAEVAAEGGDPHSHLIGARDLLAVLQRGLEKTGQESADSNRVLREVERAEEALEAAWRGL